MHTNIIHYAKSKCLRLSLLSACWPVEGTCGSGTVKGQVVQQKEHRLGEMGGLGLGISGEITRSRES